MNDAQCELRRLLLDNEQALAAEYRAAIAGSRSPLEISRLLAERADLEQRLAALEPAES